jgi:branched-chain amino acid transport system ATP-binding protein
LLLSVDGLEAGYGRARVLRGVHVAVREGEIVCVLGANGAGKTTMLRTISGVLTAWKGTIQFDGKPLTGPTEARARQGLGHVPEGRGIFATLTVEENLVLGLSAHRARSTVAAWPHILDVFPALRPRLKVRAGALSGGQQQMLSLARGLVAQPRLLMVDELSLGLAPVIVEDLYSLISTVREAGTSFLLVEQSAGVLTIADRAFVLSYGETVLEDDARNLRSTNFGKLARVYLGSGAVAANSLD